MESLKKLLIVGIGACCLGLGAGLLISQSSSTGSQAVAQSDNGPSLTPDEQRAIDEAGPPVTVDNRLRGLSPDSPLLGLCQERVQQDQREDNGSYPDDAWTCEVLNLLAEGKIQPGDYSNSELAKVVTDAGGDPPPPDVLKDGAQR